MFDTLESAGKMGAALCAAAITFSASALNPVALPEATVTSGNARFTVLTPEMIRIEFSDMGVFEDRPTFTVQNRESRRFLSLKLRKTMSFFICRPTAYS